jgi:hypothetical protein
MGEYKFHLLFSILLIKERQLANKHDNLNMIWTPWLLIKIL